MKRHLILIRHAEAESADFSRDADRALTVHGLEQAQQRAQELRALIPPKQLVHLLCSEAVRTRQTAAAIAAACGTTPQPSHWLYEASRADWEDCLREIAPTHQWVIAVGHNPGISQFATRLLASSEKSQRQTFYDFSVAGLLWLSADGGDWSEPCRADWIIRRLCGVVSF